MGLCGIFLILLTACEQKSHKTDSMLRLEEAQRQAQLLVDKANKLLSEKVLASPQLHLDSIVYAKKVSDEAIKVYDKAKIRDWKHPELKQLRQVFLALQPELALLSIDLLVETTEKTIALRKRVEEVKNIPLGGDGAGVGKMVQYLSKNYNAEINDCCLVSVKRISEILLMSPDEYSELTRLSHYIYAELEKVVSDEERGNNLLARLDKLSNKMSELN